MIDSPEDRNRSGRTAVTPGPAVIEIEGPTRAEPAAGRGTLIVVLPALNEEESIAGVLAWSAIPLGTLLGGLAITWTGNVALVYAVSGVLTVIIPLLFALTPLGHAERYMPGQQERAGEDQSVEGLPTEEAR